MVTLKEIAKEAGVSVSVVSRVLNPQPDRNARFSEETAKRIRATVKKLGYQPNRAAQFLKRGKVPSLGVFLPPIPNRLMGDLIIGMSNAAGKEGYPLSIHFGFDEASYREFIENNHNRSHCGILTYTDFKPGSKLAKRIQKFHQDGGSVVLLNHYGKEFDVPAVFMDEAKGAQLVAKHLLSRNCSSYLYCGPGFDKNAPAANNYGKIRYEAFSEHLAEAGQKAQLIALGDDLQKVRKFIQRGITEGTPGIFAASDEIAGKIINWLAQDELQPGADYLIVGYDDLILSEQYNPPLTTVHQPFEKMGETAVQMTVDIMDGKEVTTKILSPTLIKRATA